MDIDPGDGPGVADDALTPTERLLLEYLRAGMPDAEMAVRLGLPTGDVKARIERLMWRPGAPGRGPLRNNVSAEAEPPQVGQDEPRFTLRRNHDLHWRAAMLAFGLVLGTMLTVLIGTRRNDDTVAVTAPPRTAEPGAGPTVSPTRKPAISAMDGIMVASAGEFFEVHGQLQPVARSSTRQDGVVAWLQWPGAIRLSGTAGWQPTGRSFFLVTLAGRLGDLSITLEIQPGDGATRFLLASEDSIGVYSSADDPPVVLLRARTPDGQRLHLSVGRDGQLYVGTQPLFSSDVVDDRTGELLQPTGYLLEPTGGLRLGALPPHGNNYQFVWCEEGVCRVERGGGRLTAPTDGRLACRADGILELDAGDFRLRFDKVIMGIGKREPSECTPPPSPQVRRGDELAADGQYIITAVSSSGEPISVAVALNGTVYVGKFAPTVGCPCWGRT